MTARRWRIPAAKTGEIKIIYGRPDLWSDPDLCVAWGGDGADKSDARISLHALTEKRFARAFPSMEFEERRSLIEELEERGYDITTLKFTISRKNAA